MSAGGLSLIERLRIAANSSLFADTLEGDMISEAATALEQALEALEPLVDLKVPKRRQGIAAFYSLFHDDIERARTVRQRILGETK